MTTTEFAPAPLRSPARSPLRRVLDVTRLHFANPWPLLITPTLIMFTILAMTIAIWLIVQRATAQPGVEIEGFQHNGGAGFIFIYMLVVAVQAVNLTFAFALGYGATRRDFYLGTVIAFVALSVIFTALLTVLGWIEEATGGWGLGGRMFTVQFGGGGWLERSAVAFLAFVFFFFVGTIFAAVFVRWKATGLVTLFALLGFALIGLGALATWTDSWPAVGEWFVANGVLGVATWSLAISIPAALIGYLLLRRATPRG